MAGTGLDIQDGLARALGRVQGLRVADHIPEQLNPPVGVVQVQSVTYHRAMRGGLSAWEFVVTVISGRMGDRTAMRTLDGWMSWDGVYSVRAALEDDQTLAGVCSTVKVNDMLAVRPVSLGDATYLSCEFNVYVNA
jgi:hypothetical protein